MENKIPVNAAAKTVERLSIDNAGIEDQIAVLTQTLADNKDVIKSLEKSAKWDAAPVQPLEEVVIPPMDITEDSVFS